MSVKKQKLNSKINQKNIENYTFRYLANYNFSKYTVQKLTDTFKNVDTIDIYYITKENKTINTHYKNYIKSLNEISNSDYLNQDKIQIKKSLYDKLYIYIKYNNIGYKDIIKLLGFLALVILTLHKSISYMNMLSEITQTVKDNKLSPLKDIKYLALNLIDKIQPLRDIYVNTTLEDVYIKGLIKQDDNANIADIEDFVNDYKRNKIQIIKDINGRYNYEVLENKKQISFKNKVIDLEKELRKDTPNIPDDIKKKYAHQIDIAKDVIKNEKAGFLRLQNTQRVLNDKKLYDRYMKIRK